MKNARLFWNSVSISLPAVMLVVAVAYFLVDKVPDFESVFPRLVSVIDISPYSLECGCGYRLGQCIFENEREFLEVGGCGKCPAVFLFNL